MLIWFQNYFFKGFFGIGIPIFPFCGFEVNAFDMSIETTQNTLLLLS
jgi:hypothetical protein